VEAPQQRLAQNQRQREQARARVIKLLRGKGREGEDLIELMDCFQVNAAVREQALSAFQLAWPLLRAAILAVGEHLVERAILSKREQVFFLERDEIEGILAGTPQTAPGLEEVARGRQLTWQRRCRLEPPDALPVDSDNPQVPDFCGYRQEDTDQLLLGQGVSAGVHRGRVRVIHEMTGPLNKGDVLVIAMASPALTPLMLVAGALVVDVGGGASHSSLVARELGLPTVVNTLEATQRLHDGQLVEVDGGKGIVRILQGKE
jgi:pyruvate,water dikinase